MAKQIPIDPELHSRFKAAAKALGFKVSGLTERLIREWLASVARKVKRAG